jgi:hypothetical protein
MSRRKIARYWVLSQDILARPGQKAFEVGLGSPKEADSKMCKLFCVKKTRRRRF